ncbi:MAG: penicillin acylase family protein [Alphaproteobacteria bacterium]|nr:penicillin acylase family protein [Alphaproteobacteria bacterium]
MRAIKFWTGSILTLLIVIVAIGFGWLRSSLPQLDGTIRLNGPTAEVTIARDAHGIPHIGGASDLDLFFAMGFVHAQDRLWQMEMNRRIGLGRLAEILGEDVLGFDKYFRTLGFADRARSAWEKLDDETRAALMKYADGVNAFLQTRKGALPPEFVITGTKPEPWTPIDTLVWQKMMWLSLSGNMRWEIARARMLTRLTPEQVRAIYPPYPGDEESVFPALEDIYKTLPLGDMASVMGGEPPEGVGSNNWVISGERTKSGKPLLANDPHLGLTTPNIWYMVRLHNRTTGSNLVGASFPGSPSVVLGRNDKIAWGFTNTAPDIQDLFIEKLVGDDQYLTPTGPSPFKVRDELIKVKGAEDILLKVRETRHGPVVTDILSDQSEFLQDGYVLALQWTALQETDTAVTGLLKLAHAKDFEAFQAAGRYYFGPEQNMVYADTDGNIGYYAPALVPIRHPDNEIAGRLPSPGWDAKYDWQGFIPYAELPTRYNPEGGVIATANEKIVGPDYPHYITRDWAHPYRGNRIRHLLHATERHAHAAEKHDLDSFKAVQTDTVSDMAREVAPLIARAITSEGMEGDIARALLEWDGDMAADRPEPLIFYTWMHGYQERLMSDELGDLYTDFRRMRPRLIKSTLFWSDIPRTKMAPAYYELEPVERDIALAWCDDKTTEGQTETCVEMARESFTKAIANLSARYGSDWKQWKWGNEHILTQSHRPFSQVPVLKDFFEIKTPIAGSTHTINVAGVSEAPESQNASSFGPSYRGIFDLSNLDASLYAHPTGQSGNPLSPHFNDLFPLWRDGIYFTISTQSAVPSDAGHVLTIKPASEVSP